MSVPLEAEKVRFGVDVEGQVVGIRVGVGRDRKVRVGS